MTTESDPSLEKAGSTPAVSWGTLLKNARNLETVAMYPWLLIPGIFVIVAVLAFNFPGDGLRDAADPYK